MTSDSIRTRPRMSAPRMSPAALGFRAMASAAALMPLPCAIAPNPAAIARAKPAVMIDQRTRSEDAPAAAVSCAYTGANTPAARTSANVRTERLLTTKASLELLNTDCELKTDVKGRIVVMPPPAPGARAARHGRARLRDAP